MTSDRQNDNVVNLNQVRKARARAADEKQAAENRMKFGRTKAEKQVEKSEVIKADKTHDAHRLEPDKPE